MTCSFCGAGAESYHKLMTGPGVTICDRCVVAARAHIAAHDAHALDMPCSFCDTAEGAVQYRSTRATICGTCVEHYIEILREAQAAVPVARVVRR